MERLSYRDPGYNVDSGFAKLYEPKAIWTARYQDTQCWIVVREAGPCFIVQWYPARSYKAQAFTVRYCCATLNADENEGEAIQLARSELERGPSEDVLAKAAELSEQYARNGSKGGRARVANAAARKSAPESRLEDTGQVKGAYTGRFEGLADVSFDPKQWYAVEAEGMYQLKSTLKGMSTCGAAMARTGETWSVTRGWYVDGSVSEENRVTESVATGETFARAQAAMVRLAHSDVRRWTRGEKIL